MGTFDQFSDITGQLQREGETITLTFAQGLPVTGQGTVTWNIPAPSAGCEAGSDGFYCGMVVLLSRVPLAEQHIPVAGKFYTGDPTANFDTHTGDTIGGTLVSGTLVGHALVIGAFYEGDKKSRGEELTTTFIVTDLEENVPYYVAGYAADCQARYHSEGQRAYSDNYGNTEEADFGSQQTIQMNGGASNGVKTTDGTNLIPSTIYEFDVEVNENFPEPGLPSDVINVKVDGLHVQTYEDLITEINIQLSLADNPPQQPVPPNAGSYLIDIAGMEAFQFNGLSYDSVDALFEPTDPAVIGMGDYWFDTANDTLQRWNIPSPTGWNLVNIIKYLEDPTSPQCDDYWFDGADAWLWNGSTWCDLITIISENDPVDCPVIDCGTFWYDETSAVLNEWSINEVRWIETTAIFWPEAPNQLSDGTYWFDLDTNLLSLRTASAWVTTTALIQEDEPTPPLADGQLWFNPENEELKVWDNTLMVFNDLPVLVWAGDPTIVESCDLWWDSVSDILYTWDVINSEWDQVAEFIQSPNDPAVPPVIAVDTVWYQPSTNVLSRWDGGQWVVVTVILYPTDPTSPVLGDAWLNTTTGVWSIWDTPSAGWNVIDPVDLDTDPNSIPQGTLWFDTTTNAFFQRVGSAWVSIPFTTSPISPTEGDLWFNSDEKTLNTWNGFTWVVTGPRVAIGLSTSGNLVFTTKNGGSNVCTMLIVPGAAGQFATVSTGFADFHSFGHFNSFVEATFNAPPLSETNVSEEGFLFNNLPAQILPQIYGRDGIPGEPMYNVVGIGDDGTPDERRELAGSLRAQLGYPVIDVELTSYQLDEAIQGGIESLRKRSEIAYKRGFFFMDVEPQIQAYRLTNKKAGFHKIVNISTAHRFTSAFLSTAHGAGVYGQVVLQHLYNMGTYDLTSFHLVAQYIEQLEHLFATRLTFHWDESSRVFSLHHTFVFPERILLDCSIERTEQELLKDRWCKTWIEKYALSQSRYMLAEIRGKYASLPGAGGGVSLNAADLITRADQDMADLYQQLDDMVPSQIENWGMGTTFVIG